jgi:hypothetical protein
MSVLIGLVIAWVLCGALVLLAAQRPNAGRIVFGILFLVCSLGINGTFAVADPAGGLRGIAHPAPIPGYRDAVEGMVRFFAGREVVFFALLMAYELAVGLLYLAGRRATRIGILGGVLFNASIVLVFLLYTTMNLALVAAQLFLLQHDYAPAFPTRLRAHPHLPRRPTHAAAPR